MVRGKVKNGKVVLQNPKALPDGAEVEVRLIKKIKKHPKKPAAKKNPQKRKTLAERMAPFIGVVKDLPPDMSVNHDHYLYGVPKQETEQFSRGRVER